MTQRATPIDPIARPLTLTPEASLNRLPVSVGGSDARPARHWVSAQALHSLLLHENPDDDRSVRGFLQSFDPTRPGDARILAKYSERLASVLTTALSADHWLAGSPFQQGYAQLWRSCETVVLGGGLTSGEFGQALAKQLEIRLKTISLLVSPWGGQTGMVGLAQHLRSANDLVVMDFGATGIKRGIARYHGNKVQSLPELTVDHWLDDDGLFRANAFRQVLNDTRTLVDRSLPVAISLACYLNEGHPFDYRSGVYHRLFEDCDHLATELNEHWLPEAGFDSLALLEHDSTAAALAFRFPHTAIMVTLGTGLGVGLCPVQTESDGGE
ncbi:hypothetical protein [Saccharospirillum salsuginis]|uniref:Uncharacterized protein n=1 Tax=Saccharospirillum salsuginis TaxID=418750 RepID=A0A918KRH8_9GAMM|nr:hypothetical protein [Saccharospirillum salsuginis]GGX70695.1 hypothetical protein GCM10007392_42720 [Saccharospirillum salsuginis]